MANNYYSESDNESTPKAKASNVGMKNDDGRLKGSGGSESASFKSVGVEPNDGAPELKKNPGHLD